jgi:hypothetical protein
MGLNGYFISLDPESFAFTIPFLLAGGIKTAYDIGLGVCFVWKKSTDYGDGYVEMVDDTLKQSEKKIDGIPATVAHITENSSIENPE